MARAAVAFARDPNADDGSCVLSQVKNNLGRLDLPSLRYTVESVTLNTAEGPAQWGRLRFLGETDAHVDALLRDAESGGEERQDSSETAGWLRDYLTESGGAAEVNTIFEQGKAAGGWSPDQLRRAKKKLRLPKPRKDGLNAGWVWTLPGGPEDGAEDGEGST